MKKLLLPLIGIGFLASCSVGKEPQLIENTGYAQGSTYQVKYLTRKNQNFASEIESIFEEIDNSMSTYKPASKISELNKGEVDVEIDELFSTVLTRSLEIAKETNGDFDPTVGPLVQLWGFGFEKIRGDLGEEAVQEVKAKTGYTNIEVNGDIVRLPNGFSLDFNAIAQGFTVDYIAEYLEENGIQDYMIEVGGEVRTKGFNIKGNIWTIGVDKPQIEIDREERFQFILALENAALATSGNYRKYWVDEQTGVKYSHTIDPHTGTPARNRLLSASIISPAAMDADAYATVCMVKGLEGCKQFLESKTDLEGYLIYTNDADEWEVHITEGFQKFIKE